MVRVRRIRRLLLKFRLSGHSRRLLVVEAVARLFMARVVLNFVPFQRIAPRLGDFVPPDRARAIQAGWSTSSDQTRIASEIGWAVTRSARYTPFKAVCLPQAMAAHAMLKRRGIRSVMHFGAVSGLEKPIDAHAWLDAAGVEVTGYPLIHDFAEIACFV